VDFIVKDFLLMMHPRVTVELTGLALVPGGCYSVCIASSDIFSISNVYKCFSGLGCRHCEIALTVCMQLI
jgi:hypothetical protein